MKLNPVEQKKLVAAIEERRLNLGLSVTELSGISGVEQSQASRICMGKFSSISSNVMQICIALGLQPHPSGVLLSYSLAAGLASLWDGSKEGEERLLKLLKAISAVKEY